MGRDFKLPEWDIALAARRLLYRPALTSSPLTGECGPSRSLADWIDRLSDPAQTSGSTLAGPVLCRFAADFLAAYLHPEFISRAPEDAETRLIFEQFVHRRHGTASLENQNALRNRLLRLGFALCMVADLPRTAHILGDIITRRLDPSHFSGRFTALDIGAGTGVLSVAMAICARRNGFQSVHITALERDTEVAESTDALLQTLGIGKVVMADAKDPAVYERILDKRFPVAFVSNETLPSQGHRLWKEDFVPISQTLMNVGGETVRQAEFFPLSLAATVRDRAEPVELCAENGFEISDKYPMRLMKAWGIRLQDGLWSLERIGEPFRQYVSPDWLPLLGRRW